MTVRLLLATLVWLSACGAINAQEAAGLERVRQFNCVASLVTTEMKKPEVLALLGPPTHLAPDGALEWSYRYDWIHQGHYRIRFDAEGVARETECEFADFTGWHWSGSPRGPTLEQLKQVKTGEPIAEVVATIGPFLRRDPDRSLYWEGHPKPDVQLNLRVTMNSDTRVGSTQLEEVQTTTHRFSLFGLDLFETRISKTVSIP